MTRRVSAIQRPAASGQRPACTSQRRSASRDQNRQASLPIAAVCPSTGRPTARQLDVTCSRRPARSRCWQHAPRFPHTKSGAADRQSRLRMPLSAHPRRGVQRSDVQALATERALLSRCDGPRHEWSATRWHALLRCPYTSKGPAMAYGGTSDELDHRRALPDDALAHRPGPGPGARSVSTKARGFSARSLPPPDRPRRADERP
jgi:hypothetical protein